MALPGLLPLALLVGRIALVASSNQADGQPTLRYADRDGERVAGVLSELGSFAPSDVWTLPGTSVAALRRALDQAEAIAAREPGSEIVLYYSGHADGQGLLIGGERFTYQELRARLARSRATLRVAVLDACNAGGAAQTKGGRPGGAASFEPVDPTVVRGAAIIAASTADELAQESSEIGGSYFTHYLISALRGAGDRDGSGTVTLGEAYAYAYAHTVAATVPSLWGPQHPSYDYRLSGAGELVLTTLRRARQGLAFAPAPGDGGAYTVLDDAHEVVAEVRPDPRRAIRLALPAGRYRVALRAGGRILAGDLTLPPDVDVTVDRSALHEVRPEYALAKGARPSSGAGLFADFALIGRGPNATGLGSEAGATFRYDTARWSLAERASYGETDSDAFGIDLRLRRLTAATYVFRRSSLGLVDLQLGGDVMLTYAIEDAVPGRRLTGWVPGAGAALALELPIWSWVAARFAWDAGVEWLPIDGRVQVRPALRAALGIGVRQ